MEIDKTTFNDLSIFHHEEEYSVFHKLNFTKTTGGREWLARFFTEPFNEIKRIHETQDILKRIIQLQHEWPSSITNGTIMVMEKFYETAIDSIPDSPNILNAFTYRFL